MLAFWRAIDLFMDKNFKYTVYWKIGKIDPCGKELNTYIAKIQT
jgi:hypothetical protein